MTLSITLKQVLLIVSTLPLKPNFLMLSVMMLCLVLKVHCKQGDQKIGKILPNLLKVAKTVSEFKKRHFLKKSCQNCCRVVAQTVAKPKKCQNIHIKS
jgi:hypothetical protein